MIPLAPPTLQEAPVPESLGALLARARKDRETGRMAEAVQAYDAILAQVPNHETALLERAVTLSWMGHYQDSRAGFIAFQKAYPARALDADLNLARIAAWQDHSEEALRILGPWVQQEQRQALLDSATYMAWSGRLPESLRRLRRWLVAHPEDREARLQEATVLGWDGQFEAARASYHQVLAQFPQDREALAGLARLAAWEGDPQKARKLLNQMDAGGLAHKDSQLLLARIELAEGRARKARVTAEKLTSDGSTQKEAQELLEDLVDAHGPWVELSTVRMDTNEGLRTEDPTLRARLPVGDGHLDLATTDHDTDFRSTSRSTGEASLGLTQPLGPRMQASVLGSRMSRLAGDPAYGYGLALDYAPLAGLGLHLDQGRSWAIYTPAALALRTSFTSTNFSTTWRPGQERHVLSAGVGQADISAGSTRKTYFASYEYRFPTAGLDLRGGLLSRGFGYSQTLPLGFFNPERYRWNGLTGSASWHKGRVFESSLALRAGQQTVNGSSAQFTWSYTLALTWNPHPWPLSLFASWSQSVAGLPVADPADPANYRDHTLRFGLRLRGKR